MTLRWYLKYFMRLFFGILYIFWSLRSQESNASNGVQIGVETRKIWMIEENYAKRNQRNVSFAWTGKMDQRDCFYNNLGINFAWTCEFSDNHAKCAKMMLECCRSIYISYDHAKWIILIWNRHLFIKGSHDSNFCNFYWEILIWKEDFTCSLGSFHVST